MKHCLVTVCRSYSNWTMETEFIIKIGDKLDINRDGKWIIGKVIKLDDEKGIEITLGNGYKTESIWISCQTKNDNNMIANNVMRIKHDRLRKLNTFTTKHYNDFCPCIKWSSTHNISYCAICNIKLCTYCAAVNIIVPIFQTNAIKNSVDCECIKKYTFNRDSDDDSSISEEEEVIQKSKRLKYHCKECEFSRRYNELFIVIKYIHDSIFKTNVIEISIIHLITNYAKYYDVKCYKQIQGDNGWVNKCAKMVRLDTYDSTHDADFHLGETIELKAGKIGTIVFIGSVHFAQG